MTRFVIGCDVALRLAETNLRICPSHQLFAPTLLRSEFLAQLYAAASAGLIERRIANRRLDYLRGLKLRMLGDRGMQRVAWDIAARLHLPDTYQAEYLALTRLQADAFVTLDQELARKAEGIVLVAEIDDLLPKT